MLKAKIFQGPCSCVEIDLNAWLGSKQRGELQDVQTCSVHGMTNHVIVVCFYESGEEWTPPAEVTKAGGGEAPHQQAEPQSIRHDESGEPPQTPPAELEKDVPPPADEIGRKRNSLV